MNIQIGLSLNFFYNLTLFRRCFLSKVRFFIHFFKKIFFLSLVFFVLAAQNSIFVYIENMVSCFPATIITTQKGPVEQTLSGMTLCSISLQSERMTFDSSIFNHYETLPVKEIFLYSVKIPYQNWMEIKNLEDTITEANPYIEEIVSFYLASKMKCLLLSFIFSILIGLFFVLRTVASNKITKKQFLVISIVNSILYIAAFTVLATLFPPFVIPLSATSAGVLFLVYLITSIINYRLAKW